MCICQDEGSRNLTLTLYELVCRTSQNIHTDVKQDDHMVNSAHSYHDDLNKGLGHSVSQFLPLDSLGSQISGSKVQSK